MARKASTTTTDRARNGRAAAQIRKTAAKTSKKNLKQVASPGDRAGGGPVMPSMEPDPGKHDMQQTSVDG